MIADAQTTALIASEVLESIDLLVVLIAKGNLTHGERKSQLELLSNYIEAQKTRFAPTPEPPSPSISNILGQNDKATQWVEGVRTALRNSGEAPF
jgi:hypothetical protein